MVAHAATDYTLLSLEEAYELVFGKIDDEHPKVMNNHTLSAMEEDLLNNYDDAL